MNINDLLFCCMDVVMILLLASWVKTSKKVIIEARANSKIIFTLLFCAVGVMSFFQYEGWIRYVQTISLMTIGILFYFVKSGVSEEGMIVTGILSTWNAIGKININQNDGCISFKAKKRNIHLFFDKKDLQDIRKIFEKHRKKK